MPAVLLASGAVAEAAKLRVPAHYSTIQAAVDAAADGDVILVAPGTYPESIVWASKSLDLIGAGSGDTIVDPSAGPDGRCLTLTNVPDPARVVGLTCRNGIAATGGGMRIDGSAVSLVDIVFEDNTSTGGPGGGLFVLQSTVSLSGCTFRDNAAFSGAAAAQGGGLFATDGTILARETVFTGNVGSAGGGMATQSVNATLSHCLFNENGGDGFSSFDGAVTATESRFIANQGSGLRAIFGIVQVERCAFRDNVSATGAGLRTRLGQTHVVDSTFAGNSVGMRPSEEPVTVTRSAFTGNTGRGLLGSIVDLSVSDSFFGRNGGGIAVTNDSIATITTSVFVDNETEDSGGGVFFSGIGLEIRNSVFRRNRAALDGGGVWVSQMGQSSALLINDVFDHNRAGRDGGGLFVARGDTTVLRGIFRGNEAGGSGDSIAVGPNGSVTVRDSIFLNDGEHEEDCPVNVPGH